MPVANRARTGPSHLENDAFAGTPEPVLRTRETESIPCPMKLPWLPLHPYSSSREFLLLHPHIRKLSTSTSTSTLLSTAKMTRNYASAIAALNTLQSNYATVDAIRKSGRDANALAIPEMIEWCRRIGYQVSHSWTPVPSIPTQATIANAKAKAIRLRQAQHHSYRRHKR